MWAVEENVGSLRYRPGLTLREGNPEIPPSKGWFPLQQRRGLRSQDVLLEATLGYIQVFGVPFPGNI